ncbi:MAG: hypothetical protein LUC43_01955, partial [Burkholderiales bacterium]|nr:hypothetical protein [Burkholderiales bacterium]
MQKKTLQDENLEKAKSSFEELKTFPVNYTYFVICLSSIFGKPRVTEIVDFWSKYRPILKEIFNDFPDYDISAEAIRKLLTLTNSKWSYGLLESVVNPITDAIENETLEYEGGRPIFSSLQD